ncbi:hypothetical protein OXX59_010483, partial [Metschnikowia pulcherrima]
MLKSRKCHCCHSPSPEETLQSSYCTTHQSPSSPYCRRFLTPRSVRSKNSTASTGPRLSLPRTVSAPSKSRAPKMFFPWRSATSSLLRQKSRSSWCLPPSWSHSLPTELSWKAT